MFYESDINKQILLVDLEPLFISFGNNRHYPCSPQATLTRSTEPYGMAAGPVWPTAAVEQYRQHRSLQQHHHVAITSTVSVALTVCRTRRTCVRIQPTTSIYTIRRVSCAWSVQSSSPRAKHHQLIWLFHAHSQDHPSPKPGCFEPCSFRRGSSGRKSRGGRSVTQGFEVIEVRALTP
ncbi:uncharacterized protein LY79DRAFT_43927 [Colletotrichum navitas]|uniref:Uncharacterized protein n=1 Tax=Colletotrichum navitas TaxID=681940 RepID=A0AAD8PMB2_9PEZI|nr:uncharacterized protein LY79DRAFT_43927 [Colletotrichum navitas]KAK1572732.1 hypothetical protein LY79DRAFT_43927 [Colletotrichum navitas]